MNENDIKGQEMLVSGLLALAGIVVLATVFL